MPFRYDWADESHVIMQAFVEVPWTWDEYTAAVDGLFAMIRSEGRPCGLVIDISRMGSFPGGDVMSSLTRMERLMPDNVFASAVVGAPYAAMIFLDILFRIRPRARRRAMFVKTIPEAHRKIKERYQQKFASSNQQE